VPFFTVRCKNPVPCDSCLDTPYFTAQTAPERIKDVLGMCRPIELTCGKCGYKAIYSREDLSVFADVK